MYLNDISYCLPLEIQGQLKVTVYGLSGSGEYEIVVVATATDDNLQPRMSNKLVCELNAASKHVCMINYCLEFVR